MKYLITIVLACLVAVGLAQQNSKERINRDLEVAAEVLSTLLEREQDGPHFGLWGQDIEARYMPEVGAVFTLPSSPFGLVARIAPGVHTFSNKKGSNTEVIVSGNAVTTTINGQRQETDENRAERNGELESAVRQFFTDYGSLLRRLDRSDQVVVKTAPPHHRKEFLFLTNGGNTEGGKQQEDEQKGIEISVQVADLLDHDEGKIDQETLNERITVNEYALSNPKDEPELAVFGSILLRLFKPDFSETYYMESAPYFDRTGSMGVTYYVKVYSSSSDDGLHFIPTLNKGGLSQEERNEIIDGLYEQFVSDFKANVLDYGHTLKSLDDGEAVVFRINLTECKACEMPKEIELSVKKAVLSELRSGDITQSEAMDKFNLQILK